MEAQAWCPTEIFFEETFLAAQELEEGASVPPESYKDVYEAPSRFTEAWNHPDPFQRKKWRAAIEKEFNALGKACKACHKEYKE